MLEIEKQQKEICEKYKVPFQHLDFNLKLGIADNYFEGIFPLNGLRQKQENGTCGWYLWAGEEFLEDEDFFKPLHVYHLAEKKPEIIKYPALPEGWRFLVAENYEDVWFDENLIKLE